MLHAFLFAMSMLTAMGGGGLLQSSSTQDDDRLSRALESISQTSPEGWKVIQNVQGMKPEVNGITSAKLLTDIVHDYAFNKGVYNISPVGWAASQKPVLPGETSGRWKIEFCYFDFMKKFLSAEWEYNEATNKLYPFEAKQAPQFWSGDPTRKKKK